jgi:hypothetical protein
MLDKIFTDRTINISGHDDNRHIVDLMQSLTKIPTIRFSLKLKYLYGYWIVDFLYAAGETAADSMQRPIVQGRGDVERSET